MKFTTQEEYGLRCLIAVARAGGDGSITIPEISKSESLSQPHVAKLLALLRKGRYVASTRGQHGGYRLGKDPSDIVVGDVLAFLGGRLFGEEFCGRHRGNSERCVHQDDCLVHGLWDTLQQNIDRVTFSITLQDILDGRTRTAETVSLMPLDSRPRVSPAGVRQ